jgi:alcohol dehydrogenase class IV
MSLFLAGIRALDHTVEQQYRPNAPLPVRALAREAAGTLFESLRACHKNATDVEARQRALVGAWLSLWSDDLIGPIGPSHTLGYQLGSP